MNIIKYLDPVYLLIFQLLKSNDFLLHLYGILQH